MICRNSECIYSELTDEPCPAEEYCGGYVGKRAAEVVGPYDEELRGVEDAAPYDEDTRAAGDAAPCREFTSSETTGAKPSESGFAPERRTGGADAETAPRRRSGASPVGRYREEHHEIAYYEMEMAACAAEGL